MGVIEFTPAQLDFDACAPKWTEDGIRGVIADVVKEFGYPIDAIMGRSRHQPLALARHVAMYLLRHVFDPPLSYPHIGRVFGRDHTSIIAAERKIMTLVVTGRGAGRRVSELERLWRHNLR